MLNKMSIKSRLFLYAVVMSFFTIVIGLLGWQGIKLSNQGMDEIYHGSVDSIQELSKIVDLYAIDVNSNIVQITLGTHSWENGFDQLNKANTEIFKAADSYLKTITNKMEGAQQFSLSIKNSKKSLDTLINLLKKKNLDELKDYLKTDLYSFTLPIIDEAQKLIDAHVKETVQDYQNAVSMSTFFGNLMLIVLFATILIAWIFSRYIINSITAPLKDTVRAINAMSVGDFTVDLNISSEDEIGQMMGAMKKMIESTKKMILPLTKISEGDLTGSVEIRSDNDILAKAIYEMIIKLKQMILKTQQEIIVLANSTEEITSSITQVSSGTAETAAAVTETTTTVEELKQTAQISSEKAQEVLNSAESSLKVVKMSSDSVGATIEDMSQIQDKMNVISESIIKLSEHCLTIGDIINSVNDLAEQSNLLAVNAAIEAAKAGEQGKSFGVVAQEIRILAEQSKAATTQIRSILNDIQNSTSSAVMATEQGSKAVSKGVQQSSQTNSAMQSLSSSVSQVTQSAKQIAISSQQQLIGVEQVTNAMTDINRATTMHVEHMKQIEIAVNSLHEVSQSLLELTNLYKLEVDKEFVPVTKQKKQLASAHA